MSSPLAVDQPLPADDDLDGGREDGWLIWPEIQMVQRHNYFSIIISGVCNKYFENESVLQKKE